MADLAVVRSPAAPVCGTLRRDVSAVVRAYDLDDDWLARVLHGRRPAALTVGEIRASLGLTDGPATA